jgi:hypothetical protein
MPADTTGSGCCKLMDEGNAGLRQVEEYGGGDGRTLPVSAHV